MSDQQIKARASRAQAELTETDAAFTRMREQAVNDLIASTPSEAAKREQIYHAIKTIDTVRDVLMRSVKAGEAIDLIAELTQETEPQG